MLFASVTVASAEDYKLTVKLQEFSSADGKPIEMKTVLSTPTAFKKLIPGDVVFMHKTAISADQELKDSVHIDSTDAQMSYKAGKEEDGLVNVTVEVTISKVMTVRSGVPIKSTQSVKTTIKCAVGQDTAIGGSCGTQDKTIKIFVITVE